jgi:hypothetical protein
MNKKFSAAGTAMRANGNARTYMAWLGDPACHDLEHVGGKAATLSRLAADHTVPPGFCLTADAFKASQNGNTSSAPAMPAAIATELKRAYERLIDPPRPDYGPSGGLSQADAWI